MDDKKKQNKLIWSILAVNIITLVMMSAVAYVGWGVMNEKLDNQALNVAK